MTQPVIYPEGILTLDRGRSDSVWFQNEMNPIATIIVGDREASVFCLGEVRVRVGDFVYRNVNEIIDFGINDDEALEIALERGDIEFLNNNWFEVLERGDEGLTEIISYDLFDAIDAAKDYLSA